MGIIDDAVDKILEEIPEQYRGDAEYIMRKWAFRKEALANEALHDLVHLLKHIKLDTKKWRARALGWVCQDFAMATDWKPAWWDASMAITPD
jgi:hypothetical protein